MNVSCQKGNLVIEAEAWAKAQLKLLFTLKAALEVILFSRFKIFESHWELLRKEWDHEWDIPIGVTSGVIGPARCGGASAGPAVGGASSAAPPALLLGSGPGSTPGAAPAAPAAGGDAGPDLGITQLSVPDTIKDLIKLAGGHEVVKEKDHGLPDDPAAVAKKKTGCKVKRDPKCGTKALPDSRVPVRDTGSKGQGRHVRSSPLTKCEGDTKGSAPKIRFPPWDCIKRKDPETGVGETALWVHAHLLHGRTSGSGDKNLHGPGVEWNLIISDKKINGEMSRDVEQPVIGRVFDSSEVLWYDTTVDYMDGGGDMDYFAKRITVSYGKYDTDTGTEGPQIDKQSFDRDPARVPPKC